MSAEKSTYSFFHREPAQIHDIKDFREQKSLLESTDEYITRIKAYQNPLSPQKNVNPYYLERLHKALETPHAITNEFEFDGYDEIDIRMSLQTTCNYLSIRTLEKGTTEEELQTIQAIKTHMEIDSPHEALMQIKEGIQMILPQYEKEYSLPDSKKIEDTSPLLPEETAALANYLLKSHESIMPAPNLPLQLSKQVQKLCKEIKNGFLYEGLSRNKHFGAQERRSALEKLFTNASDVEKKLLFVESHRTTETHPLIYWLYDHTEELASLYLHDKKIGEPYFMEEGELEEKIAVILEINSNTDDITPERPETQEQFLSLARKIEDDNRKRTPHLVDSFTNKPKRSVSDYLESEKKLQKALDYHLDSREKNTEEQQTQDINEYTDIEKEREFKVLKFIPNITDEIDAALQKHFETRRDRYSHKQLEEVFNLSRRKVWRVQDEGIVKPTTRAHDNYHPFFTPEEAIATIIFNKFYENINSRRIREEVKDLIRMRLDGTQEDSSEK